MQFVDFPTRLAVFRGWFLRLNLLSSFELSSWTCWTPSEARNWDAGLDWRKSEGCHIAKIRLRSTLNLYRQPAPKISLQYIFFNSVFYCLEPTRLRLFALFSRNIQINLTLLSPLHKLPFIELCCVRSNYNSTSIVLANQRTIYIIN